MNEESRDESGVLGKAIKLTAVGASAYRIHKGVRSDRVYNWATNQRDNVVASAVLRYNKKVDDIKSRYASYKRAYKNGNSSYVNAEWSYKDTPKYIPKKTITGNTINTMTLKEGLNEGALARQVHLDKLRNGGIDRRVGNTISNIKGGRRKISRGDVSKLKAITKAL